MPRDRLTLALAAVAVALPVALYFGLEHVPPAGVLSPVVAEPEPIPSSSLPLTPAAVGSPPGYRPLVTNVQIVDLDRDGRPDIVACDARRHRVVWHRQAAQGRWEEHSLGDRELPAPCHTQAVDLDGDGDLDLVVAVLGSVWPTNDRVGQVAWLENRGGTAFVTHILIDDLLRVADVQAGDLNGDGRPDLAVAEFGYDHGRILLLENAGGGRFRDHAMATVPGTIHVPLADFDGDGDLDILAHVSQEDEEVWAFENLGGGRFRRRVIHTTLNFDLGGAGVTVTDLDRDGKPDLLLAAGDNLEVRYPAPQPWHGCYWLRNLGGWKVEATKIGTLGGTYAAAVADLDADGDTDVVLASMFNDWRRPGAASLVWLENDGKQNFRPWRIADRPTHLCTVAAGDLDGDGRPDVAAGGFHILEPFDRLGGLSIWLSRGGPR